MLALAVLGFLCVEQANAQVRSQNGVTFLLDDQSSRAGNIDFVNATALPLPINPSPTDPIQNQITALLSNLSLGVPGYSLGSQGAGTGALTPIFLGTPAAAQNYELLPPDYGTNNHPFSTARADLIGPTAAGTNTSKPYSAAGKLFFKVGQDNSICSGSLIKKGIVVTAAHCVMNYGQKQFYDLASFSFVPGYRNGAAPFGEWRAYGVFVLSNYYNGTDGCAVYGVVCPDDIAILILQSKEGTYPGTTTGVFGYGWNGYGFAGSQTHVTQIGYPAGLDNAAYMERNDSSGYVSWFNSNNTIIGSNMDGGSSGGPWIVNFGIPPVLTGETNGSAPGPNIIVGVTSWGYKNKALKEQGASPFTSNNIVSLVGAACAALPGAC